VTGLQVSATNSAGGGIAMSFGYIKLGYAP
jgi:hypothetical protein